MSLREAKALRVLVVIFTPLILLYSCANGTSAKIGDEAQDFSLPSLSGEKITLGDFRGKNVFLFFWTQGCVFCQTRSVVAVNDIFSKGKEVGLEVLSINIAEPLSDVREFVKQKKLIFTVLSDRDAKVSRKKFGVHVVPTLFLIDQYGVIKDKAYGYLSEEGLMDFVRPYLEHPRQDQGGKPS